MSTESPFQRQRVEFTREPSFFEKIWRALYGACRESFINAIPSDNVKQLPPNYLFTVGFALFACLAAIFVAVFVPGYESAISTKYLSPASDSSTNSKYCETVATSNSGSYLATRQGYWNGNPNFYSSNATYELNAANLQLTYEEFQSNMQFLYDALQVAGRAALNENLAGNLLFWMSWGVNQQGNINQRFYMTGSPQVVFDQQHIVGVLSSVANDCNATAYASFDSNSAIMSLTYQVEEFASNPTCNGTGTPSMFGYSPLTRSNSFSIQVDIRSVITAIAVNSGLLYIRSLQQTEAGSTVFNGVTYSTGKFTDPRYTTMQPILCLYLTSEDPVCIIQVGAYFSVPLLNHNGQSYEFPYYCNCSTLVASAISSQYDACNGFTLLTGFIFWPTSGESPEALLEMLFRDRYYSINRNAYDAMYVAGAYGMASPQRSAFESASYRTSIYQYCNVSTYGPCSMVTFTSFATNDARWVVSDYHLNLFTGACTDTMSTSQEDWQKLSEQPFAPLNERYETCRNNPTTAFFNQAGVSAGNVSIVVPIAVIFVLLLFALYQCCTGKEVPVSHSRSEKDAALDAWAVALLLVQEQRVIKFKNPNKDASNNGSNLYGERVHSQKEEEYEEEEEEEEENKDDTTTTTTTTRYNKKGERTRPRGKMRLNSHSTRRPDDVEEDADTAVDKKFKLLARVVDQLAALAPLANSDEHKYRYMNSSSSSSSSNGGKVAIDWEAFKKQHCYCCCRCLRHGSGSGSGSGGTNSSNSPPSMHLEASVRSESSTTSISSSSSNGGPYAHNTAGASTANPMVELSAV